MNDSANLAALVGDSSNMQHDVLDRAASYDCATVKLPHAQEAPALAGTIRVRNTDFEVTEQLGFAPSGSGEHLFHFIEKTGLTSLQLRDELAGLYSCAARDIGFAGMKDKHACTRQWFSVPVASAHSIAANGDTVDLPHGCWRVLELQHHQKKLHRGAHDGNRFRLRVSGALEGACRESAWPAFLQRVDFVQRKGFPNYFGDQRFGRHGLNVVRARQALQHKRRLSKDKRSLYISALRSFLYNELLKSRVVDGSWSQYCSGDKLILDGSNSFFAASADASPLELNSISERLASNDIHIGGLLYGAEIEVSATPAAQYEAGVAAKYPELLSCLNVVQAKPAQRALRALPNQLEATADGDDIVLDFGLPAGSYATVMLRELLHFNDAQIQ